MGRSSSPLPGAPVPSLEDLYDLHQVIGQGAYGVVWLAVDRRNGRRVAVKKITNVFEDVKEAKRTLREVRLMRHFRNTSPYILNMHDLLPASSDVEPDAFTFRDLYVVTEYVDGGDLSHLCNGSAPGWAPPSEAQLRTIAFGLLSGLRVLHAAHVLHRDLRPKNILVSGDTIKIADFGMGRGKGQRDAKLAKRSDEKQTPLANRRQQQQQQLKLSLLEFVSNRYYTAPEGLLPNNEYDYQVDCWAVGCVLVELLLGYNPFKDSRFPDQMRTVINLVGTPTEEDIGSIASGRNERFRAYIRTIQAHESNRLRSLLAPLSPDGRDLVEGLLRFNPSKRLTAAEALAHSWLTRDALSRPSAVVDEAQEGKGRKEAPFDGADIEVVDSESELRALLWREIEIYHKLHGHVHHHHHHQDPPSSSSSSC